MLLVGYLELRSDWELSLLELDLVKFEVERLADHLSFFALQQLALALVSDALVLAQAFELARDLAVDLVVLAR